MWSVESFGLVAFEIFNIILSVFSLSFSSAGKGQFLTGKAKNCTPWGGRRREVEVFKSVENERFLV